MFSAPSSFSLSYMLVLAVANVVIPALGVVAMYRSFRWVGSPQPPYTRHAGNSISECPHILQYLPGLTRTTTHACQFVVAKQKTLERAAMECT